MCVRVCVCVCGESYLYDLISLEKFLGMFIPSLLSVSCLVY